MAFQVFEIESLADICLVSPKRLWEIQFCFSDFFISPLAFCPMQLQNLANVWGGDWPWVWGPSSLQFCHSSPTWMPKSLLVSLTPVGTFCQGPRQDFQPLAMPSIGKWPQVKSGCRYKLTMPSLQGFIFAYFVSGPSPGQVIVSKYQKTGTFHSLFSLLHSLRIQFCDGNWPCVWGPSNL